MVRASFLLALASRCSGQSPFETTYNVNEASGGVFTDGDNAIQGFFPTSGGPFPLFLWMPGTDIQPSDAAPQHMTREMAQRGYASVAVQYPSYFEKSGTGWFYEAKTRVMVADNSSTPLSIMCAQSSVDCSLGVAIGGYSQGTHLAILAAKYSDKITAAFSLEGVRPTYDGPVHTVCDNVNIEQYLPKSKRRYILGEGDMYYGTNTDTCASAWCPPTQADATNNMIAASGYDCGSAADCVQADGSGYYITTTADTGGVTPDHTNWCTWTSGNAIADWFNTDAHWALPATLDWLAQAARTSEAVSV